MEVIDPHLNKPVDVFEEVCVNGYRHCYVLGITVMPVRGSTTKSDRTYYCRYRQLHGCPDKYKK